MVLMGGGCSTSLVLQRSVWDRVPRFSGGYLLVVEATPGLFISGSMNSSSRRVTGKTPFQTGRKGSIHEE